MGSINSTYIQVGWWEEGREGGREGGRVKNQEEGGKVGGWK
jgi:hypothetical protein